ncbi:MAG: ribose-phosphate pyrophosphokinase [Gammaproteobacteria bacterium RIFCSPLOWO2_02_FULL_42_14]|nr:MAG: ribose-phosphate pyrophosphokinase [Gammaproteobacteria bacterium RIFCSPHIGHO2_02_FULL_42_43]OGT51559.1 MAG: ribose-phosphate pyrophosphokinase [Gammaproteobacteria bacterium RIFCSPHIGHO2_12_FULL_41_25]OGT62258.1 MAG: ribose-phosphate pyrophosphokinase [Gammaproteobacteria bacterium RIFCSPLOWO2_02_FULL_42_14]OGT85932.1 MAG: ribose-phosphate pyrophosphokinase [Gammaproteobacteria bacterium RIFCSPLOWO2_12_FULL_42_18]
MAFVKIFAGSATPVLAERVVEYLGLSLGKAMVGTFSDGETRVEIRENVRGRDVFMIQSTSAPCNDNLMELLFMADALRRASATSITAVVPYFGYARQDRRVRSSRVPISAKVVADMIAKVGITRLITVDLHADQIQGFFSIPVDNVYASPLILEQHGILADYPDLTVVSPDVGGVVRARAIAKRLHDADLAIIDKRRPTANQSQVMNVIGRVENRDCLIVDDIVDTAGTLCHAAEALKERGAKRIAAYCTHPVLSGKALEYIEESILDAVIVTDTIPLSEAALKCKKIKQVSLSGLIAETISRITTNESVSSLFED